ncbi:MAG: hypothetical protein BGO98_29670 [Myxococcales bacterium 68-20]|nr:MAG: hypothetical protein BGO98_29670 [Myxococcales bacterium 68-20]
MDVKFLKGPIPWPWLLAAVHLRGSALAVGVHLWLWSGIRKSPTVPLNLSRLPIPRAAASRALRDLEEAGLIRVDQKRGQKPVVTIVNRP